jgi:hypothetical protein
LTISITFYIFEKRTRNKKKTGVNEHGLPKVGGLPDW